MFNRKAVSKDIFVVIIIILLCLSAFLFIRISSLNTQVELQNMDIVELNSKFLNLNDSFEELKYEKESLEEEYTELTNNYVDLKSESADLISDINTYQTEIQNSLEWYKDNSFLDDSSKQERVKQWIDFNCYQVDDECRIKLGCFYFINVEKMDLEYKYDSSIYSKEDKLTSIENFLDNSGGDCEDYSLFYKAEYNYALSQCENKPVVLEGWAYPNEDSEVRNYWVHFGKSWFLDDVVLVNIEDYVYPNVVCGSLFDPVLGDVSGHCMLAFSKEPILSIDDLDNLNEAFLIEPQDGSFQGNIDNTNSEVYLLSKFVWEDDSVVSWIDSVITDTDYYLFDREKLSWNSYSNFDSLLQSKKVEIKKTII